MHDKKVRLFIFLLVLSTFALAQKNEVSVSAGVVATQDQQFQAFGLVCPIGNPNCGGPFTIRTSTNPGFEGDYVRQIFNFHIASIGAEFPILGVPNQNLTTNFGNGVTGTFPQSSVFFTPSARIKFLPSARFSPFLSLGGGLAHLIGPVSSLNRGTLQFGGGVDFNTPLPHLAIRGEVRDFWSKSSALDSNNTSLSPERVHRVFAGLGIVIKF